MMTSNELKDFWNSVSGPAVLVIEGGSGAEAPLFGQMRVVRHWSFWLGTTALLLSVGVVWEVRTSTFQAWLLTRLASKLTWYLAAGPSESIVFPRGGPFDQRRGYSLLPVWLPRLEADGFYVTEQARISPQLRRLTNLGIPPPYDDSRSGGLVVRDSGGASLFEPSNESLAFLSYEELPTELIEALLFVENRKLEDLPDPESNPALDWDRTLHATLTYLGSRVGLHVPREGGSTLATQIEKFRHSPAGRTRTVRDKFLQMASASIKAYRLGADTRPERRRILFEYLNSVPLAAAPGYGDVHGIGEGLWAWFGVSLDDVKRGLSHPRTSEAYARTYQRLFALLCAARAPTHYLVEDRPALKRRIALYAGLMARAGILPGRLARRLRSEELLFSPGGPRRVQLAAAHLKSVNGVRESLMRNLELVALPQVDAIDVEVSTSIDGGLEEEVRGIFDELARPSFVEANRLQQRHLLAQGDPSRVLYSLELFESTAQGNLLRADVDSLEQPFDLNEGMKLQLGSTAKLRVLTHYLEIVSGLYDDLMKLDDHGVAHFARVARDPITRWAAETARREPSLDRYHFLESALDRTYSASPSEEFFTGGGVQAFHNFDAADDGRIVTIREATWRSINLAYVRLLRDIVRYHQARLAYDVDVVLRDRSNPVRRCLLERVAGEEARESLGQAYEIYRALSPDQILTHLLGKERRSARALVLAYLAWHSDANLDEVARWLGREAAPHSDEAQRLFHEYARPAFTLSDFAYLLHRRPLDVWMAGQILSHPCLTWDEALARSEEPRRISSAWLFKTSNRAAQERRLRILAEEDAFDRIGAAWIRLGYPFSHLVPSLATALGSSGDRPAALADLMGIIINGGLQKPAWRIQSMAFASGTPYETHLSRRAAAGVRVLPAEVARVERELLSGVVQSGTARRLAGAFRTADGTPAPVGGKTGSGDNEFKRFERGGRVVDAQPVNRTATFVFYVNDRFFGALTAFVPGKEAGSYAFTSALPVQVLKLLAPYLNQHWDSGRSVTRPPTLDLAALGRQRDKEAGRLGFLTTYEIVPFDTIMTLHARDDLPPVDPLESSHGPDIRLQRVALVALDERSEITLRSFDAWPKTRIRAPRSRAKVFDAWVSRPATRDPRAAFLSSVSRSGFRARGRFHLDEAALAGRSGIGFRRRTF
jgi:membrane peptidoglycan carboxypeptidase